ncbi:MAG: hypothetical protein U0939_22170 [Pirellulales bacterium]
MSASILSGIDAIIDGWLGLQGTPRYGSGASPAYFSRSAAIDLSDNGGPLAQTADLSTGTLIADLLTMIDDNWKEAGSQTRGSRNWLLRKAADLDDRNESAEKILEKLIVQLLGPTWFNQIPTCSGMVDREESKRSIDLGHDCGQGVFEFIELKYGSAEQNFGSDHPLYAAFEILKYGLLFAHARNHGLLVSDSDARPLSAAKTIRLQVLAPAGYYDFKTRSGRKAFDLAWLESAINKGLASMPCTVTFDFQFQRFTSEFEALYSLPVVLSDGVRAFQRCDLTCREPVYGHRQLS